MGLERRLNIGNRKARVDLPGGQPALLNLHGIAGSAQRSGQPQAFDGLLAIAGGRIFQRQPGTQGRVAIRSPAGVDGELDPALQSTGARSQVVLQAQGQGKLATLEPPLDLDPLLCQPQQQRAVDGSELVLRSRACGSAQHWLQIRHDVIEADVEGQGPGIGGYCAGRLYCRGLPGRR